MLAGYDHLLAAAARLQWDAEAISLDRERGRVRELNRETRDAVTELVAGFWVAEHAVASALAPFIAATAPGSSARACFAQQAIDEARHARFFDRVAAELLELDERQLRARCPQRLAELFESELPARARALADGVARMPSAVGLYHLVLEGIVFAIGQDALRDLAQRTRGLPGLHDGISRVQDDERWHIGLGVLHLQRLGAPIDVADDATAAAGAWGPDVATAPRVARVMAVHERRLRIAGGAPSQVVESAT